MGRFRPGLLRRVFVEGVRPEKRWARVALLAAAVLGGAFALLLVGHRIGRTAARSVPRFPKPPPTVFWELGTCSPIVRGFAQGERMRVGMVGNALTVPIGRCFRLRSSVAEGWRRVEVSFLLGSESVNPAGHWVKPIAGPNRRMQQEVALRHPHVGYLGLAEWFARRGSSRQFIGAIHYSLAGHAKVAELLSRYLLEVWPGRQWLLGRGRFERLGRSSRVSVGPPSGTVRRGAAAAPLNRGPKSRK